ncbi:2-oxoglutarate dehydrogenase E1 component [Anaeromyxobacter oryzae]|uniref:oxoglutarate dehydrogenase (succinyl-transferring) n=1 Tax=Anaeromyxobacter oryzae TaxID=2918170 RepID=A0ABM7WYB0_9BACT|nr:2-oxoglutarate dehydrogenase E1 component [Anaeromyxobacter oryzae]BDG04454.1 2-oxoglutarate dehydrogenase subunit E1 [Anaeromyxobacter oryzae]
MPAQTDPLATPPSPTNLSFVENLYYAWLRDPSAVDAPWRAYFENLPPAPGAAPPPEAFEPRRANGHAALTAAGPSAGAGPDAAFQAKVDRLVQAYREYGHLRARLDPLGLVRPAEPFTLEQFGLSPSDLDRPSSDPEGRGDRTLRDLVSRLEETYCRTLGVELAHIHDQDLRGWLEARMERTRNRLPLAPGVKKLLLEKILQAESLEQFLGTRFLGAKRFSVEGAEGFLALLEFLVDRATGHGVRNVVIGMAHRGRLNVLANIVGKPLEQIFAEFRDNAIINAAGGDVKYHLGYSSDRETPDGVLVHLSLSFNPSHLEWIDPVVQGRVRAKQDRYQDFDRLRSLPVLVHGDAAFAGQGIVAEILNMSQLEGYAVGGTIHVIVNNQVGFTTAPRDARSTTYATGPARMLQIPLIHVNGEDIEAVAQAVLLAVDFRMRFHHDVVIDLWGYRRHGHNEGDEPSFTQPVMYRTIARKPTLRAEYAEQLVKEGTATPAEVEAMATGYRRRLEAAYQASAKLAVQAGAQAMTGFWKRYRGGLLDPREEPRTAVKLDVVRHAAEAVTQVPQGFAVHPKLQKVLEARAEMGRGARPLDWGMGEALAIATLALDGTRIRLVGQDVRRGTFSHRHAVLFDYSTGVPYTPLAHLREGQGTVEVRDSLLSEAAALGYEYGYSLEMPEALTIWEAQFGDFVNAAQVILDQFLASGEAKWNRLSGLVLLLPHGMEGQGPEHSSARLERFLELSVDDNWRVVNLTTPAQYFHALRRQVVSPWRKPLVVMSPKSLLRHPRAVSSIEELAQGGFQPVIADPVEDPGEITRVVLCSGKVYYDLVAAREASTARHVALVRVEELYPVHHEAIRDAVARFRPGVEIVWAQEEPANMGAWDYVDLHLSPRLPRPLELVSRPPSASPAVGSMTRHKLEQEQLVRQALGEPMPRTQRAETRAAAQER